MTRLGDMNAPYHPSPGEADQRERVAATADLLEAALRGTEPRRRIWDDRDYLCAALALLTGDGLRARDALLSKEPPS